MTRASQHVRRYDTPRVTPVLGSNGRHQGGRVCEIQRSHRSRSPSACCDVNMLGWLNQRKLVHVQPRSGLVKHDEGMSDRLRRSDGFSA